MPDAKVVAPMAALLQGSLVGDIYSVSKAISEKTQLLKTMGSHLQHLPAHDAVFLICYSFAIPKLLHILMTCPCSVSPVLQSYDNDLRYILSVIHTGHLEVDSPAWTQASLPVRLGWPVRLGGLGVRLVSTTVFVLSILLVKLLLLTSWPFPLLIWQKLKLNSPKLMMKLPHKPLHLITKECSTSARWVSLLMRC